MLSFVLIVTLNLGTEVSTTFPSNVHKNSIEPLISLPPFIMG